MPTGGAKQAPVVASPRLDRPCPIIPPAKYFTSQQSKHCSKTGAVQRNPAGCSPEYQSQSFYRFAGLSICGLRGWGVVAASRKSVCNKSCSDRLLNNYTTVAEEGVVPNSMRNPSHNGFKPAKSQTRKTGYKPTRYEEMTNWAQDHVLVNKMAANIVSYRLSSPRVGISV